MADDAEVSIGTFSRATGLGVKALRLYAQAGALSPARVDESSGYRFYRVDQVATGQLVRTLRELGVPVAEVAGVLAAIARGSGVADLLGDRIRADATLLDRRRRLLAPLDARLKGSAMTHAVSVRTWNTDPALMVRASAVQGELDEFLADAYRRLYAAAGTGPLTTTNPGYTRYHARVDDESTRVSVDACLPFAADRAQPRDVPEGMEVLPGASFLFASATLRGEETLYPRVLDGTDAVAEWTARHGFEFAGPADEIHRVWTGTVGDERNVLEVGFPVAG